MCKVTDEFLAELELQAASYRYSDPVHQSYGVVRDDPFYEVWNTVTTAYLAHPEFFAEPETMDLAIETEGYEQGTIRQRPGGRQVEVVLAMADKGAFYDYVLAQLRRDVVR